MGIADEENERIECVARQTEALDERADMEIVLVERILEAVLLSVDLLRPLGLFLRSEDPAPVVLCFNDEDPEAGHDDMVELGASLSVGPGQVKVVKSVVSGGVEAGHPARDGTFTKPTFEAGRANNFDDEKNREKCENPRPVGDEGFDSFVQVDLSVQGLRSLANARGWKREENG